MEAKELNLDELRNFIHHTTCDNGGVHLEELSSTFRKIAIELSLLSVKVYETEKILDSNLEYYLYILSYLADTFDKIKIISEQTAL